MLLNLLLVLENFGFCGVGVNFSPFPRILCSVSVKARLDRLITLIDASCMSLSECVLYVTFLSLIPPPCLKNNFD